MNKIIIILFEIQRDKDIQSCTNLSKGSAMFVPQLSKAPIKGCIYGDSQEGLSHSFIMHDVITNLSQNWRDKVVQRRANCPEIVQDQHKNNQKGF